MYNYIWFFKNFIMFCIFNKIHIKRILYWCTHSKDYIIFFTCMLLFICKKQKFLLKDLTWHWEKRYCKFYSLYHFLDPSFHLIICFLRERYEFKVTVYRLPLASYVNSFSLIYSYWQRYYIYAETDAEEKKICNLDL